MKIQITKNSDQAKTTAPKKFVEAKEWENGQRLRFKINNKGNLEIVD